MPRHAPILFLLLAPVLLAGCDSRPDGAKKSGAGGEAQAAEPVRRESVPVQVVRPARGPMAAHLATTASLEARQRVDVFAQAAGVLQEIAVEEGDAVAAGQLLARLDEDDLRLAEEKARVNFEKLEADLARNRLMLEQKLIPPEKFDDVKFQHKRAQVEWQEAKLALARARVVAPIAGTVVAREARFGDLIARNARLFTLADTATLLCKAYVPEKEMARLRAGQPALLASDALPGREFKGTLELLSPVVDPTTGTQKVQIAVENPDKALRPGMFVSLAIVTQVHEGALLLPKKALLYEDNRPGVFVVRDGTAVRCPLELGLADRDRVEVAAGLAETDDVILVGQNGLREGAAVKVVK